MFRVPETLWHPGVTGTFDFSLPSDGFEGKWADKNWRNIPGPSYGADTDTCGTGWMVHHGS